MTSVCSAAFTSQPPNFLVGDDMGMLVAHVKNLASNKWLRMDLGDKGRAHVVKHCSWQPRAKKILDLALPGIKNL
jgi:hypothetical protein